MNEPLRVAWLGHQSGRAGDGLLTYSRETVAELRARGDKVFIFSEQQKGRLDHYGVPAENVAVIPNGVDVDKYAPGPSDVKPKLHASALVGYLGRVDPEKNVDILIRAFQDVDAPEDVKLVIVGSGSEKRRLERRYGSPRIVFTGQVLDETERIAMLRAMDIFVLPSMVEGLSLSLLEAMACGVAPVAADVGSDGEALRGAGIVRETRDRDGQLRLALRTLIEFPDFRRELGRRARARAVGCLRLADHLETI